MKNSSASIFLKHIISVLCSITKAKSMAIRNKTSALKARLIVLSLLKNKKFSLGSISQKIQGILGHQDKRSDEEEDNDQNKAIVLYNALESVASSSSHTHLVEEGDQEDQYYYNYNYNYNYNYEEEDGDDKYPDLTHSLFEEEDELDSGDPNGSVIDLVKNSKEGGEDFKLEDEIDQVADLFIMKFHKRMRMQKLASFKRYQEMLQRGV
ncbi:hypothetical protein ACSBR1_037110 [Camellia fascicularis]